MNSNLYTDTDTDISNFFGRLLCFSYFINLAGLNEIFFSRLIQKPVFIKFFGCDWIIRSGVARRLATPQISPVAKLGGRTDTEILASFLRTYGRASRLQVDPVKLWFKEINYLEWPSLSSRKNYRDSMIVAATLSFCLDSPKITFSLKNSNIFSFYGNKKYNSNVFKHSVYIAFFSNINCSSFRLGCKIFQNPSRI